AGVVGGVARLPVGDPRPAPDAGGHGALRAAPGRARGPAPRLSARPVARRARAWFTGAAGSHDPPGRRRDDPGTPPPHMDQTTTTAVPALAGHIHAELPATPSSVLLSRPRLVAGLFAAFVTLATGAALWGGELLLTWDEPIQRSVESRRTAFLDDLFLSISRLGSTIPVLVLGAV